MNESTEMARAVAALEPAWLHLDGLGVTYGGGAIGCSGITIEVPAKTVVAIAGRNGAGKTSLLRSIAGFLPSEPVQVRGEVRMAGVRVGRQPVQVSKAGIVFVPERDKVFPSLTVAEHFRLLGVPNMERIEPFVFEPLRSRWTSKAGLMSGGERQMLALAMAWAQRPKVLLVDELSLGLAPIIVQQLLRCIREMVELTDMAVLLVEQDVGAALQVASRVVVLEHGEQVWSGLSSETSAVELTAQFLGAGS